MRIGCLGFRAEVLMLNGRTTQVVSGCRQSVAGLLRVSAAGKTWPLSRKCGTYKTVKARFWLSLSGKNPKIF